MRSVQCLKKHSPKSIAVEKIFTNKNPESTLKLEKQEQLFLVAARFKIDIFEYSPNTVKKNIVGYGHAQKNQVIDMVKVFFSCFDFWTTILQMFLAVAFVIQCIKIN